MRASAGDDIPLSTANGRDSGWIAIHQYIGAPYEAYFQGVEQIMNDYNGSPHWGKLHYQSAMTLAHRYPEWDRFRDMRAQLDPTGTFRNAYLDRVLAEGAAVAQKRAYRMLSKVYRKAGFVAAPRA